jgi:hypothetical protein
MRMVGADLQIRLVVKSALGTTAPAGKTPYALADGVGYRPFLADRFTGAN